ncbi:MAG: ECF transporter S component [Oscillospiraceae bacterium]|nr:ECF transporter S component [Oscillospiraceae bacterium]
MVKRWLSKYSVFSLILIAVLAALGVAVKPVVSTLARAVTGGFIPGGGVAGGIYMLFPVLAASLTGARGAASLCGLCQGLLALAAGVAGSHGALSPITYTLPGLAADLMFLIFARKGANLPACFFAAMLANLAGTVSVGFAFFSMPPVLLLLSLFAAAFSGALGGIGAWFITKQFRKWNIVGS